MAFFKEEKHLVVYKKIDGEWKLNTYIPDGTKEFESAICGYRSNPNFYVAEATVRVPIMKIELTPDSWDAACKQALQFTPLIHHNAFYEVANCLKKNFFCEEDL